MVVFGLEVVVLLILIFFIFFIGFIVVLLKVFIGEIIFFLRDIFLNVLDNLLVFFLFSIGFIFTRFFGFGFIVLIFFIFNIGLFFFFVIFLEFLFFIEMFLVNNWDFFLLSIFLFIDFWGLFFFIEDFFFFFVVVVDLILVFLGNLFIIGWVVKKSKIYSYFFCFKINFEKKF